MGPGEIIGIIFVSVVLPLAVVLHYVTKWKTSNSLTSEDENMLEDLWKSALKMESRINTLESILDDEVPQWRKKI